MPKIAKTRLPREILVLGNARMWLHIFKAMPRKEFLEYPEKVRKFDDMTVAEYYAWRRVRDARDNEKLWQDIQKTTEGYPAAEGTIQRQHHVDQYKHEAMMNPNQSWETTENGALHKASRDTIKSINGGTEKMLKGIVEINEKGLPVEHVVFMGKKYPVTPDMKTIKIEGVNFTIVHPEAQAEAKAKAKEKAPEPKAEKPAKAKADKKAKK